MARAAEFEHDPEAGRLILDQGDDGELHVTFDIEDADEFGHSACAIVRSIVDPSTGRNILPSMAPVAVWEIERDCLACVRVEA